MNEIPWRFIKNRKGLRKLIANCKKTGYASIDFETNALPIPHPEFYPTILGVSFQIGSAYVIPLGHFQASEIMGKGYDWHEFFDEFNREVIQNPKIVKIAWNLKFEYQIFLRYNCKMQGILLDGMLAHYLLDENSRHGLKDCVREFLPEYAGYEEDYDGCTLPWAERPIRGLSNYCALDCHLAFKLTIHFERRVRDIGLYSVFRNLLMMATRNLAESEFNGIDVDKPYLLKIHKKYSKEIARLTKNMEEHKVVLRYEKKRIQERKREAIKEAKEEIAELRRLAEELEDAGDSRGAGAKLRSIKNREDRIARLINNQPNTNKEREIFEGLNFNSPNQIIDLFFTSKFGFQFPIVKYTVNKETKKETDRPSTDEEVLIHLKEKDDTGFIDNLLNLRAKSKLFSTYVDGILERLTPDNRIHASFLLHGTVTGRLSSRNPNLQNIPRDTTASDIKHMFTAPDGYKLLQMDYSQAELRVLAAEADEKVMLEWFNTGKDIHLASACKKYGEDYEEIIKIYSDESHKEFKKWKIRRKQAKTINFGIVYGQGANMLAGSLSEPSAGVVVDRDEAQKFLDDFHKQFPNISRYIKKKHKFLKKNGYVKSVFGRKRRLPGIWSDDRGVVAKAKRDAVNAPIQGAASDYTQFSSVLIRREVLLGNLPSYLVQVFTVHDSLGYYIKEKDLKSSLPLMYEICRNPKTKEFFGFQIDSVEMKVDFEVSDKRWSELAGYEL